MTDERMQALHAVSEVLERHIFISEALNDSGGYIRRAVRGVCERAIELDARINAVSSMKIKRMHPKVRSILRLGAYEILYMDSIPPQASVSECVSLAKRTGQSRAAGLINAVLRKISDEKGQSDSADKAIDPATRLSLPDFIYKLLCERFGEEGAEAAGIAFLSEKKTVLRINRLLTEKDELIKRFKDAGIAADTVEGFPMALVIDTDRPLAALPGFDEGLFYFQDTGSMQVVLDAGINMGDRILDVCASPGGKALFAAELAGKEGFVLARDVSRAKISRIMENAGRLRIDNIRAEVSDARQFDKKNEKAFDVVFCDVPCSGLGVLGRKPEIKYRLKKEDIDSLVSLQEEILENSCRYVADGGRLIYSTCTLTEQENEAQTKAFLKRHSDFEKQSERVIIPGELAAANDGFYICTLRRREALLDG